MNKKKFNWKILFNIFLITIVSGYTGYAYNDITGYNLLGYCLSAAVCGWITMIYFKSIEVKK